MFFWVRFNSNLAAICPILANFLPTTGLLTGGCNRIFKGSVFIQERGSKNADTVSNFFQNSNKISYWKQKNFMNKRSNYQFHLRINGNKWKICTKMWMTIQLLQLSVHLSAYFSVCPCVWKLAQIPEVISQNVTNKSCLVCVKIEKYDS